MVHGVYGACCPGLDIAFAGVPLVIPLYMLSCLNARTLVLALFLISSCPPPPMQDDSKEACLEYANAAALRLLQAGFEDVFDTSSFQVVHPAPEVQQVWQGMRMWMHSSMRHSVWCI